MLTELTMDLLNNCGGMVGKEVSASRFMRRCHVSHQLKGFVGFMIRQPLT